MHGSLERRYANIGREQLTAMMNEMRAAGLRVSGCNPWLIDTMQHGVLLTAEWIEESSILAVTITNRNWYVPYDEIWKTIDPLMVSSLVPPFDGQ